MHSGANLQTESFCNLFVRKVSIKRELEEILGVLRNDVINSVTFFRVNEEGIKFHHKSLVSFCTVVCTLMITIYNNLYWTFFLQWPPKTSKMFSPRGDVVERN